MTPPTLLSIDALPSILHDTSKVWVVYLGSTLDPQIRVTVETWTRVCLGRGRVVVWADARIPATTQDPRVTAFRMPQIRFFSKGRLRRKVVGVAAIRAYVEQRLSRWGLRFPATT